MGRKEGAVPMPGCLVSSFTKSIQLPVVMAQGWGLCHECVRKVPAGCRMSLLYTSTLGFSRPKMTAGASKGKEGGGKKKPQFHEDLLGASTRRT